MPSEIAKTDPRRRLADAVVVEPEVLKHYAGILPAMTDFYEREGHRLRDAELMIALDQHFGEQLTTEVCVPLGFYEGACVLIGTILLRQRDARY